MLSYPKDPREIKWKLRNQGKIVILVENSNTTFCISTEYSTGMFVHGFLLIKSEIFPMGKKWKLRNQVKN